jgi:glucosamine--fructose-6-phosphate aminotransferase (isomerizing)
MCGIVGYIGSKDSIPILIEGLRRLEYRGYDSAGIATITKNGMQVYKKAGKVAELANFVQESGISSQMGIGHTRWATHGEPNDVNAHPHYDCTKTISVIHNGIIENYNTLKKKLEQNGHVFRTETDTETLAHLIEEMLKHTKDLFTAVRLALHEVEGTYGIAVISKSEPDKIVAARKGSPLVIGVGENENLLASDPAALIDHTRQVIYLEDGEVASITKSGYTIKTIDDEEIQKQVEEITFDLEHIEKGGYDHFMLKEIHEQPETLRNAIRGRILIDEGTAKLGGLADVADLMMKARRFIITACGTSWHAALVGKYMLEQYARVPVDVEYASEFRYRDPVLFPEDAVFLISQSGETADTSAALKKAKSSGSHVIGIVNVVGSSIARDSEAGVYIHAGPEIGVASTKAFTSQLAVLSLITLMMARQRGMSQAEGRQVVRELLKLPEKVENILKNTKQIQEIANIFYAHGNFLYLGRGYNFPVALEGALKLKEISYIHAEGYPAAEMKHGPIALIDTEMPVVVIATKDSTYEKIISNIQEVRARRGRVIAIVNEDDTQIEKLAEHVIRIPHTLDFLMPILSIIPLQLLAYYIAVKRDCDVDQPRNLAKSVTVE